MTEYVVWEERKWGKETPWHVYRDGLRIGTFPTAVKTQQWIQREEKAAVGATETRVATIEWRTTTPIGRSVIRALTAR